MRVGNGTVVYRSEQSATGFGNETVDWLFNEIDKINCLRDIVTKMGKGTDSWAMHCCYSGKP